MAFESIMNQYTIWGKGYRATGDSADATLLGKYHGENFKDACNNFAKINSCFKSCFDPNKMTYWGCRLFDNETAARARYG